MAHIFSISYDRILLQTRELLLTQMGHSVVSAEGYAEARRHCKKEGGGKFDLIVLGHSIPREDKRALIRECLESCSCPVLALLRPNEQPVQEATRSVRSDEPRDFLSAVQDLLGGQG